MMVVSDSAGAPQQPIVMAELSNDEDGTISWAKLIRTVSNKAPKRNALGLLKKRALSQQHANAKSKDQQQLSPTGDKHRKRKRRGGSSTPKSNGINLKSDHSTDRHQLCSSKDTRNADYQRRKRNNEDIDQREPEIGWRTQKIYRLNQRGQAVRDGGLCEVPVEGNVGIGLKLGFNYWISGENYGSILTADVRDLMMHVLSKSENTATTTELCLPWFCEKSLDGCRRVVLACANALPMLNVEGDFLDGKAPHLECWSRVPTRHEFNHKQLPSSLELKASPALLLWKELPPLPQTCMLNLTPTELFTRHTVFFEAVRGDQWHVPPDIIVLNSSSQDDITIKETCKSILGREKGAEKVEQEERSSSFVHVKLCEGEARKLQSGSKAKWVLYEITDSARNLTVGEWMKEEIGDNTTASHRLVITLEWLSQWLPEELELVRRDGSELIFQGQDTRDASEGEEQTQSNNALTGQRRLTLTMTKVLLENLLQKQFSDDMPVPIQQDDTKEAAIKMESSPSNIFQTDQPFETLEEYSLSHFNRRRLNIPASIKEEEEGYVAVDPIGVSEASEDSEEGELACDDMELPLRAPLPLVAIDCEMVYTKLGLELARVSIVDLYGEPLYDEFVKPSMPVLSYNTEFSGISEQHLAGITKSLEIVQKEIQQFVGPDTYIVGHSIDSDLHALRLVHPRIIDTTQLYPHPKGYPFKHSLKNLCSTLLGKEVQKGTGTSGHDSLADATHTMELALLKMSRGPDYATPGPWADDPTPRETIFAALRRGPIVGNTAEPLPPLNCLVIGDKHGAISSEWPSGSLWERCARGYRRESDVIWVAEKCQDEENNSATLLDTMNSEEVDKGRAVQDGKRREVVVKASAQLRAACMLQQAVEVLEDKTLAPDFTWVDLPCSPSTTTDKMTGSTINWGSIADVNAAASALYEAAPKGTLLVLVCQDSLTEAIRMKEEKLKARWAFKRSVETQRLICTVAGTKLSKPVEPSWDEEEERKLKAVVQSARKGVTFLAVK